MDVSYEAPSKQMDPMEVTAAGIVMEVKSVL
jgi:hypothetical protein